LYEHGELHVSAIPYFITHSSIYVITDVSVKCDLRTSIGIAFP